jgi:site-specific DNA-methyltransferase (adenine-specific)/adenine-specific DNA-methyltransferase
MVDRIELVWPGKYDAAGRRTARTRPVLPLELRETVGGVSREDGWRNALISGDNLAVMDALRGRRYGLTGKVDLVYVDPPFATGSEFRATTLVGPGGAEPGRRPPSLRSTAYSDTWEGGLESYLAALSVRLQAMYDLLSPRGSLYVHLDPTVAHYAKVLLDEIFGSSFGDRRRPGFRNEIVWCYSGGGVPRSEYPRKHDVILWYSKGDRWTFNTRYRPYSEGTVRRGRTAVKGPHATLRAQGTPINDWWTDVKRVTSPTDPEKLYYETQKSEQLLERIVGVASNPGDLVADFYCGSGTTLAVAEKLDRRWIGCDAGRLAVHTTRKRLLGIDGCRPFDVLEAGSREPEGAGALDARAERADARTWTIRLTGFALPEGAVVPDEVRSRATTWSDYIDYWAVDWDSRGAAFRQDWVAFRTRRRRDLDLVSRPHVYGAPGSYVALVKVVDVFGNETSRALPVEVTRRATNDEVALP